MRSSLASSYRRDPERYFRLWLAVVAGGVLAIDLFWGVLASRTYGLGLSHSVILTAVSVIAAVPALLFVSWVVREQVQAIRLWASGGGRRDQAARAHLLQTSLRIPIRLAHSGGVGGLAFVYPLVLVTLGLLTGLDSDDLFLGIGGGMLGTLYAVAYTYLCAELALRPVRAELASALPREHVSGIASLSLIAKMLVGLAITAIVLGFSAGVLIAPSDSSFWEGARIVVIAVAVTALVGGSLALPLAKGALAPIDDLIAGTRSVAAGNFDKHVPVTSADELSELVLSFNEMIDGLREREVLRSHNEELVEELRDSRARIVAASNEARRRVERDLHDGAQQSLMLLNLKLGVTERTFPEDPAAAAALVSESRADLDRALDELRDLAHGIYPTVLTSDGLPGALVEAVEQAPIPTDLDCDGAGRYSTELEAAVYFCCLEALQNAVKHAGPGASANVRLVQQDGELRFVVADDGRGFDARGAVSSAGLQNMADRIGALGGRLRVESAAGEGTRVTGAVPLGG